MTRQLQDRTENEKGWTPEERRAITVLLSRGLISSSAPVTRSVVAESGDRRRAG